MNINTAMKRACGQRMTKEEFDKAMETLKEHVMNAQRAKRFGHVENMVDAINDANALSGRMADYLRGEA